MPMLFKSMTTEFGMVTRGEGHVFRLDMSLHIAQMCHTFIQ